MSPLLLDGVIAIVLVLGISRFRTPGSARFGNLAAALAVLFATALVLARHGTATAPLVVAGATTGVAAGWVLACRVHMIHIPPMVALQNGMGGLAAFLVSFIELTRASRVPLNAMAEASALLGLLLGAATFSGSMVATGKLANRLRQTPVIIPGHSLVMAGLAAAALVVAVSTGLAADVRLINVLAVLLVGLSLALGLVLSMRIGGADMPVLISFLNAMSGLAAAFCGLTFGNRLLIVCGATVAASGLVLTQAMCRAMNRGLARILGGRHPVGVAAAVSPLPDAAELDGEPGATPAPVPAAESVDPFERSLTLIRRAERVVIIPGYGMALADAQQEVADLADRLTVMGKDVVFAIHPVAGRMPGHMHVLLAEADVDYHMISEMQEVNETFAQTDLALVVGACDVVNPAAIASTNTPISGMPILRAHEARNVIVCNLDDRPGYSGVENPLYRHPGTILLLGDGKETVHRLWRGLG